MKAFVLYRRVSTSRQGLSGLGLESQDETVRRYVSNQKGTVVGEFVEVESGKKTDAERPQLALALAECRRLKATLVVAKLDRLSRNAEFLLRLQNGNVDFVCCDCPNVDRFTVGILALVAQRERELISERTRSALQMAKNRGVRLGTRHPRRQVKLMVEGYRRQKMEFISKVRPIIDEIKSTGVSTLTGIAQCLNRRSAKPNFTSADNKRVFAAGDCARIKLMRPQTGKTASGGPWRIAYRILECIRTKWVFVLVLPLLSGCQSASRAIDTIHDEYRYKAFYANSDYGAVASHPPPGSSFSSELATILLVDGQPLDPSGWPYWYFNRIFVSPGSHSFLIRFQAAFAGTKYSLVEATVAARHVYAIGTQKTAAGSVLQLWDETGGTDKQILVKEFTGIPAVHGFEAALRTLRVHRDSSIVIGDTPSISGLLGEAPRKIDRSIDLDVMFISIDGVNCERTDYPIEMFQTRFVAEGAHRFIAKVEVLPGPLPIRKVGTIPEIEAMLVASHIYRITAEKRGGQVEIRLWDETEGTDQRTLVKEFRFGEGKS